MFANAKYVRLFAIGIHLLLGFLVLTQVIAIAYSYIILIMGLIMIISSSNKNEEVALWTAYLVGSEVFLRMTKGLFFYEMNKYAVIVFMLVGLFIEKRKHSVPPIYFLYLLLLLLGIVFTNVPFGVSLRRVIAFNLSGPFLLGIAALYFYKRPFTKDQLFRVLYYVSLPVFSMVSYMYFKTPDLSEINFGGVANGMTSGGFGPNQVATILGFAVFILAIFLFLKERLSGFLIFDVVALIYFTYRILLTFSRGGTFAAGVAVIIFAVIIINGGRNKTFNFFKYTSILSIMMIGLWLYTSNVTRGMIDNRYTNRNARGIKKEDVSAGRVDLFVAQLEAFYSHPFVGIGVGGTKYYKSTNIKGIVSHDEIGRLISEHGLIGVFLLILLISAPFPHILSQNYYNRAFLITFLTFWFLTINHSAMRVAFPGWIYGLCLIQITDGDAEDEIYE
ncbi:MAG: hypothetical protein L3J45_00395 [Flavobacteriaceae bacterium]|nr:hypothetical protein [Flavobacteriaceae bacterium]